MGDDDAATSENTCKKWYIARNVCSPVLAELLARKLMKSKFMQEPQERKGTNTLYDALSNADRVGKGRAKKQRRDDQKHHRDKTQRKAETSSTCQINNIENNKEILKQVKIEELLEDDDACEAVTQIRKLDMKFLLCILLNTVLDIPHQQEVRQVMENLLELRNSNVHQDIDNDLLIKLLNEAKKLYTCLGRDTECLQKLEKVFCYPLDNCDPILKDVQQKINESCQMREHHNQQPVQLTIQHQHIGESYQPGETVENLADFIVQKWVDSCQEPQPIVLCGEPGAGKSSILHRLMHTIAEDREFKDFLMVVRVDVTNAGSKKKFWEQLFMKLKSFFPQELDNNNVEKILSRCINKFLFVVDQNFHDTKQLHQLIQFMDRGMWVLSYQGVPEPSTHLHLLRVAPLSEEQIHQILQSITVPEEDKERVSKFYKECEYQDLLQTPDMVYIFAEICSELTRCVPFYKLIQHYIYKKVDGTSENEAALIDLGEKVFHTIKENKKYYPKSSLDNLRSVALPFLEQDHLRGYFFKYRKVEDYMAAKYVVAHPEVACQSCKSWLSQPTLFRTVFHIACALWREQAKGIDTNRHFIKKYLEKLFKFDESEASRGKKRKRNKATNEDDDDCANRNVFQRWTFLLKIAKDNQSNEDVLRVLADCLTHCHTWLFKYTSLTEDLIADLSLVLRHVQVPKKLTIKMESRTSVEVLSQLWSVFSSHPGLWHNTSVHLAISYTECTVARDEARLAELCANICSTTEPFHITDYTGPLLCSETPQFFECSSMAKLSKLDVYVCDLTSLCMVLEQQEALRSITVRLRLKADEAQLSNTRRILLSPFYPPDLTIIYFEGLQTLLDNFEQPESLCSLKIYEIFIHQTFSLDLTRFTKLEFLSLQFDCKKSEEKASWLPLETWTPYLVQHLHLPTHVGRLLMRNLTFFEDSTASDLAKYFRKLSLQRLVLVDTKLSVLKFREILQDLVASSSVADSQESPATPPKEVVKRQRLDKEERESRRRNKPEGKEVIVTSEMEHLGLFQSTTTDQENTCEMEHSGLFQSTTTDQENPNDDFAALVREVYSCQLLSINYSGADITIRKDVCGDLFVHCPLPFLDDETAQHPERQSQLGPVLEVLALAQAITLTDTNLSYAGSRYLLKHLKEKKGRFGNIEPFRITIVSCLSNNCSKSVAEVQQNLQKEIKKDDSLQQFNFRCDNRCHFFKKAIDGSIMFNDQLL